jgi:hypothetical protein
MIGKSFVNSCPRVGNPQPTISARCDGLGVSPMPPFCSGRFWSIGPMAARSKRPPCAPSRRGGVPFRPSHCSSDCERPSHDCVGSPNACGGDAGPMPGGYRVRAVDATTVQEPGNTGTDWRVHYAFDLANLQCDCFELTDARGGESFRRIPVAAAISSGATGPLARRRASRMSCNAAALSWCESIKKPCLSGIPRAAASRFANGSSLARAGGARMGSTPGGTPARSCREFSPRPDPLGSAAQSVAGSPVPLS